MHFIKYILSVCTLHRDARIHAYMHTDCDDGSPPNKDILAHTHTHTECISR